MRNFVHIGALLAICLLATPFVRGQVVDLIVNNSCGSVCGGTPAPQGTLIGTITVTQTSSNTLTLTLQMASGFSMKVQDGNDFNFQGLPGMTITGVGAKWDGGPSTYTAVNFGVSNGKNVSGFGTFGYNITGIGTGQLGSITSINSLQVTITCSSTCTAAQLISALNSDGANFAIHFCDASGTKCSQWTGFAANGSAQVVPEPSAIALLVCSAFVLGGFFRRRLL